METNRTCANEADRESIQVVSTDVLPESRPSYISYTSKWIEKEMVIYLVTEACLTLAVVALVHWASLPIE